MDAICDLPMIDWFELEVKSESTWQDYIQEKRKERKEQRRLRKEQGETRQLELLLETGNVICVDCGVIEE